MQPWIRNVLMQLCWRTHIHTHAQLSIPLVEAQAISSFIFFVWTPLQHLLSHTHTPNPHVCSSTIAHVCRRPPLPHASDADVWRRPQQQSRLSGPRGEWSGSFLKSSCLPAHAATLSQTADSVCNTSVLAAPLYVQWQNVLLCHVSSAFIHKTLASFCAHHGACHSWKLSPFTNRRITLKQPDEAEFNYCVHTQKSVVKTLSGNVQNTKKYSEKQKLQIKRKHANKVLIES